MRKLTTIILLLCALVVGAQGANYFGGTAADTTGKGYAVWDKFLSTAVPRLTANDTLLYIASGIDSTTTSVTVPTVAGIVIDLQGYTLTTLDLSSGTWVLNTTNATDFQVRNGSWTYTADPPFPVTGPGYFVVDDVDFTCVGNMASEFLQTNGDPDSLLVQDCTFTMDSTATGTRKYIYVGAADCKLISKRNTFSRGGSGASHIYFAQAMTVESLIEDCVFDKPYSYAVNMVDGGLLEMTGCNFTKDANLGAAAVQLSIDAGTTHGIDIYNCYFTDCSLWISDGEDVQQGGAEGATVSVRNSVFTGENVIKPLIMRANYGLIEYCTFSGCGGANFSGSVGAPHMVLLGGEGGDDRDNTSAENITFRYNTISPTVEFDATATTILGVVIKTGTASVYNNTFDFSLQSQPAGVARYVGVVFSGADTCYVYNNNITGGGSKFVPFSFATETADSVCVGIEIFNNQILGEYAHLLNDYDIEEDNAYNFGELSISNNYIAGATTTITNTNGSSIGTEGDAADSSWYNASTNFTGSGMTSGEVAARLNWGGASATVITPTGQRFYPIGVQTSADIEKATDPIIGYSGNGWPLNSGVSMLRFMRAIGYDVSYGPAELYSSTNQDAWFFGLHDTATVAASTWNVVASDTLKIIGSTN